MIKRILAIFTVILFAIPFFCSLIIFGEQSGCVLSSENRNVSSFEGLDSFTHKGLKKFFNNKNLYIDDRLIGKEQLVSLVNQILLDPKKFSRFDLGKGVIGQNEWIFLGNNYSHVLDKHCQGNYPLNNYKLQSTIHKISLLKNATELAGGTYILFIAPDKHNIYCRELPQWLGATCQNSEIYTRNFINKIQEQLSVDIVYPALDLKSHTTTGQLYYKSDTHWNLLGARIGFVSLLKDLERLRLIDHFHEIPLMELKRVKNNSLGDLGRILALPDGYKIEEDYAYVFPYPKQLMVQWRETKQKEEKKPFTVSTGSSHPKFYAWMKNDAAVYKKKILVLCDSFNRALSPFFNLYFSEILYVSRRGSKDEKLEMIRNFKPEIVINEVVERDLESL